ncbi:hypothetical protein RRG08_058192 [Elysia crispata]|uniref:Uncharacterized protein n=1 Tax=Elysia crispata TaxID=231223 RepID=A0AAE0ZMD3_9GAST|nr:hypothetical protein RRG08_058192 [Elysia crispata]
MTKNRLMSLTLHTLNVSIPILHSKPFLIPVCLGRPTKRYKDVCSRDLETSGLQPAELDLEVPNLTAWRAQVKDGIKSAEEKRELEREEKRTSRHQRTQPVPGSHTTPATDYTYSGWTRSSSKSRIGRCSETN